MYQFVSELTEPYTVLCLSAMVGISIVWFRPSPPRRRLLWIGIPILLLLLASTPVLVYPLLGSLEWPYPPLSKRPQQSAAIVVLGGGVRVPDAIRRRARLSVDSMIRCEYAAELYRQGDPCPVVVTGGKVDPNRQGPSVAELMRDFLINSGVAEADVVVESKSRSTYENALYSKEWLAGQGIDTVTLVTDATHMNRSRRCFQKQGVNVICAPCRHRATEIKLQFRVFLPSPSAARDFDDVAHEYAGLVWYWYQGRI